MPPENAYNRVQQLVNKFKALPSDARKHYNEDNTRKDFILPLFHALEWNIQDSHEVSAEERVSRGWVDFSFRIGGVPRFFLETKRISEVLATPKNILQAISYSWTKNVTWALLSDFEGLRVYNAEWKEDNPLQAQFLEFSVDTYLSDFERLWWLSRPEIAANTLNRQAEQWGKKTRREPVSQHLFDDLKTWRYELFRHLHAYNQIWSPAQIDEAVLRILNRLIFIRTAEDRLVEQSCLMPLLRELNDKKRIQDLPDRVKGLFREFDETYNSQLFEPGLADNLECEPSPYETVIEGLYGKQYLLYNFNAIDADVLGTAYEQYLGHVIADTQAAEIVEKRVKRKSQGIYYTPTFVVKYIVQQTVGRYLDENSYNPSHPPRVLDMACGSGSFLIEAFDVLDRHVAKLRRQDTPLPSLGEGSGVRGDLFDHARQMEILTQCIYGVDKDKQAVEVARLNLMLKALHSREKLPLLENIRCGDSLISGTVEQLQATFGANWKDKNPFNWQEEYPQVFAEGGFDIIIGNPPYVRIQTLHKEEVTFFNDNYDVATGNYDIYVLFVERAMQLLKKGGVLGFILPNKFMQAAYGQGLRKLLSEQKAVWKIIDFGDAQVFNNATTYTCLLFIKKQNNQKLIFSLASEYLKNQKEKVVLDDNVLKTTEVSSDRFGGSAWNLTDLESGRLLEKLKKGGQPLGDIAEKIFQGLRTSANNVYVVFEKTRKPGKVLKVYSKVLDREIELESELLKSFLRGEDIKRYSIAEPRQYVLIPYYLREGIVSLIPPQDFVDKYPLCWQYLQANRKTLEERENGKMKDDHWYAYVYPKNLTDFSHSKIITPDIAPVSSFALDEAGIYSFVSGYGIVIRHGIHYDLKYLLGLLNSHVLDFYLKQIGTRLQSGFYRYFSQYISQLPIPYLDLSIGNRSDYERMLELVQEMLNLKEEMAKEIFEGDHKRALQRRIAAVDSEIDRIVYALFGLTEEEIKIVEGSIS